jgi:hypothetical protein
MENQKILNQPFVILRVAKLKTWGNVSSVLKHNYRERETLHADTKQSVNNVAIGGNPDAVLEIMKSRLENINVRKNAVLGFEVLITASPQYFRSKKSDAGDFLEKKVNKFFKDAVSWARKEFYEQNVVSAVLHIDESTPHVQMVIQPIDHKNKLNASYWVDGRKKLSALQDSVAEAFKDSGLRRGVLGSTATHSKVKTFYKLANTQIEKPIQVPPEVYKWTRVPSLYDDLLFYKPLKKQYLEDKAKGVERDKIIQENQKIFLRNLERSKLSENNRNISVSQKFTIERLLNRNRELENKLIKYEGVNLETLITKGYKLKPINEVKDVNGSYTINFLVNGKLSFKLIKKNGNVVGFFEGMAIQVQNPIEFISYAEGLSKEQAIKFIENILSKEYALAELYKLYRPQIEKTYQNKINNLQMEVRRGNEVQNNSVIKNLNQFFNLPIKLLKMLFRNKLIYSDPHENVVFSCRNGAFIKNLDKNFRHEKQIGNGVFYIDGDSDQCGLVIDPLDACAYKAIYPKDAVLALGVTKAKLIDIEEVKNKQIIIATEKNSLLEDYIAKYLEDVDVFPLNIAISGNHSSWIDAIRLQPELINSFWRSEEDEDISMSSELLQFKNEY